MINLKSINDHFQKLQKAFLSKAWKCQKAWKWDWTNQKFPSINLNEWLLDSDAVKPELNIPSSQTMPDHLQDSSSIVNYHQLIRLFIHSTTNIESTTPFRNPTKPTEAAHWARSVWVFVKDLKSNQGTTSKVGITLKKKHQWTKTSNNDKMINPKSINDHFQKLQKHLSKAWKWDWTNQNFHPSIWMNGCWIPMLSNLNWTPHPVRPCPTKIWHASTHLQDSSSIVNYRQLIRLFIHSTINIESTTPFRNPTKPTEAAHWARSVWVFVKDLKSDQGTTSKVEQKLQILIKW